MTLSGIQVYQGQILYIDVDGTLINENDEANPHVLDFLAYARAMGGILYLWSHGGSDYCKKVATQLCIETWFEAFLPKPDIAVDDLEITSTFIHRYIYPKELMGTSWLSKISK